MNFEFIQNNENIRDFILKSGFKRLLLAVSGGIDSICLAHYFIKNKNNFGIEYLSIAHVNHGLRESTANRDAIFVEKFAKAQNIPFFLEKLEGESLKIKKGSLEENARDARYTALLNIAIENKVQAIVTAHHAGDQAETIYLRLRRGVTLAGLHGIQHIRNFNTNKEHIVQLYRPFLHFSRDIFLKYAKENNLSWCEDESNTDIRFSRNKIRHIDLPKLEHHYPGANKQLCRIAQIANNAYPKIIKIADSLFSKTIIPPEKWPFDANISPYKKVLALEENELKKIFIDFSQQQKNPNPVVVNNQIQGMHEIFRLWLNSYGFRFPINSIFKKNNQILSSNIHQNNFFSINIETNYHYKTRYIEKCRHIIWIYEISNNHTLSNLYFSNEKQRFSGIPGIWRHPQSDDLLNPLDMKIKARKLATWLQEKSIPHWIRQFLQVYAQGNKVLFVSGIRNSKV